MAIACAYRAIVTLARWMKYAIRPLANANAEATTSVKDVISVRLASMIFQTAHVSTFN
jgi:hypothetical protein